MTATRHTYSLTADAAGLAGMSAWIAGVGDRLGLAPERLYALDLCATEAVTNVVDHGGLADPHATIELILRAGPDGLELRIEDNGRPFNPLSAEPPVAPASIADAAIGGLGLHLVRNFVDSMSYSRSDDRNILTLVWGSAAEMRASA